MIRIEGLSVGYPKNVPLLEKLNLELEGGMVLALVGRNGSGKSTLIRTILGLQSPLEGEVKLMGRSLLAYSPLQRARLLSYVASAGGGPAPSGMLVEELVSLGRLPHTGWMGRLRPDDREKVREALELVGLQGFSQRKADHLSDGERQRVMLARALAQDTPLMILDEPAAHLDIPNRAELLRILAGLGKKGKTVLFSTHDLETAMRIAGRFWVIHESEIHCGAPEDLGMEGLFDRLFEASGMHFNLETGRFSHETGESGKISMRGGSEIQRSWTALALQRIGYSISPENDPAGVHPCEVEIVGAGQDTAWRINMDGQIHETGNLDDLSRTLSEKLLG